MTNEHAAMVKDNQPAQTASLHQAAPHTVDNHKNPDFKPIGAMAEQAVKSK